MEIFITPFLTNQFMIRALMAGFLVSIASAVVGTFIVLRGLAFIGDALAHGVLPGIALSILLGFPGIIGAAIGAVVMIGGISLITHRSRLSSDTAIGLLFVGMLALGVVIVSRGMSFSGDLVRVLFGEILGISRQALIIQSIVSVFVMVVAGFCARPFLLLCFNPEQAEVSGFSVRIYHNIMLLLIALTIIVSFQTVGTLLVFGMLLAPASAAALVARRIRSMMILAAVLGTLSVYLGLLVSYHFDLAAGAAIVVVAAFVFFVVFVVQNIRSRRLPVGRRPISHDHPLKKVDKLRMVRSDANTRVVADHLDIGYDGASVVSQIEFDIASKQALAVVGINGSGKSTLLKTVVGLLRPVGGRIAVLGQPAGAMPKRIAYLSQFHTSGFVLPLRAADVVRMGRFTVLGLVGRMTRRDHDLVAEAMQRMQIADLAEAPLRSLSGGQMQRVYLAQILCRQADLLVLDEPTAGLDFAGKKLFETAMQAELDRGASLITATHDIQEAMVCDQVMLLARRVVALGPPNKVLTPEALMETFGIVLNLKSQKLGIAVIERECGHDCIDPADKTKPVPR